MANNNLISNVVLIKVFDQNKNEVSQGSGVILKDLGVIATNFHIFMDLKDLEFSHKVFSTSKEIETSGILAMESDMDIVLLKITEDECKNFEILKTRESFDLAVSEKIYTVGYPNGILSVTKGKITGLNKRIDRKDIAWGHGNLNFIEFSAKIANGSSGGALFDFNNKFIGITSSRNNYNNKLSYAIPFQKIKSIFNTWNSIWEHFSNHEYMIPMFFAFGNKEYEKALLYSNESLKDAPTELILLISIYQAQSFICLGEVKQAISIVEKIKTALELFSVDSELDILRLDILKHHGLVNIFYFLGVYYCDRGEYGKAIENRQIGFKYDKNSAELFYLSAIISFRIKKYTDAIDSIDAAIKLRKDNPKFYLFRARCYTKIGEYEKALNDNCLSCTFNSNEENFNNYIIPADIFLLNKRSGNALNYYKMGYDFLTIEADSKIILNEGFNIDKKRCYCLLQAKEFSLLEKSVNYMLLRYKSNSEIFYYYKSLACYFLNRLDESISLTNESLKIIEHEDSLVLLSVCYFKKGDFENSQNFISSAIKRNPTHKDYLKFESYVQKKIVCLKRPGIINKTLATQEDIFLESELEIDEFINNLVIPKVDSSLLNLFLTSPLDFFDEAKIELFNERNEQALYLIKKAVQIEPENPVYYNYRWTIYLEMKLYSHAIQDLEKLIILQPDRQEELYSLIKTIRKGPTYMKLINLRARIFKKITGLKDEDFE